MYNIFYLLADPMFIVESEHNRWYIRDINQAFTSLTGYKKTELIEVDPDGLLKDGLTFAQLMVQLDEDNGAAIDWDLVAKSTIAAPIRFTCRKLVQENKSYYIVICKDLSEDKWTDEFAVDNKMVLCISATEQFKITATKRYYCPIKYNPSALINQSLFDYVIEDHRKQLRRVMEYARNNGTTEQMELSMVIFDKTYATSIVIKPFYYGNKSFKNYLLVITDLNLHDQGEDSSYKLRMLMLNKNMSATHLAQSTLISLTTISKIRNGKIKKPQRLTAELIAGELGVKPEMIWSSFKR